MGYMRVINGWKDMEEGREGSAGSGSMQVRRYEVGW